MRNAIVLFIIILQIAFLLYENELSKEHIKLFYKSESILLLRIYKLIFALLTGGVIYLIFFISVIIQRNFKINKWSAFSLFIITILNYINLKMLTNVNFTPLEQDMDEALGSANTGDIIFFRRYNNEDIPSYIFYRLCSSALSNVFF